MDWYQESGSYPYQDWIVLQEADVSSKYLEDKQNYEDHMWQSKKGEYPTKKHFKELPLGACCNSKALVDVIIPSSVKKIGPYAFAGTCIKTVSVCSSCIYEETSFPKECEVCIEEVI